MTHRQRIETAWSFREPDRAPVELQISPAAREHPIAAELVALIGEHADNFIGAPGPAFGFMGFPADHEEEEVEGVPGRYRLVRREQRTPAGIFTALTYHPASNTADYHWRKRYFTTLDDLRALIETPREPADWDAEEYRRRDAEIGGSGYPIVGLFHPLGTLVRHSSMEDVYAWFHEAPELMHRYLAVANDQVIATIERMREQYDGPLAFISHAHEMLIPPWMGHELFDEFVAPYDSAVYSALHKAGWRFRAHCHGRCGEFLTQFADMGVDSTEPLEQEPTGDNDLRRAKREVGDRMLLSGNVHSEHFVELTPEVVREQVREAMEAGKPGGGFSLRTSGGHAGTSVDMDEETFRRVIANITEYLKAGIEFGAYG